jgi:hypothetical protein
MSRRVDQKNLNREELIDALVYTLGNDDNAKRIRDYYSLLPTPMLRDKAKQCNALYLPDVMKVPKVSISAEEMREKERERLRCVKEPRTSRAYVDTDIDKLRAELQLLKEVLDVCDVDRDVLGVVMRKGANDEMVCKLCEKFSSVTVLVRFE